MAGNILLSFNADGVMKVDYSGDRKSMFGLNDVDILRALMAVEGMMMTQTGLEVAEIREMLDDERAASTLHTSEDAFYAEKAVIVEDDDGDAT